MQITWESESVEELNSKIPNKLKSLESISGVTLEFNTEGCS